MRQPRKRARHGNVSGHEIVSAQLKTLTENVSRQGNVSGHDFSRAERLPKEMGFSPCNVEAFTAIGSEPSDRTFANFLLNDKHCRWKDNPAD